MTNRFDSLELALKELSVQELRAEKAEEALRGRRLCPLMVEWQRIAHSSGWPEEAQRLIDDMLSALLAFVDPHVKVGNEWVRACEQDAEVELVVKSNPTRRKLSLEELEQILNKDEDRKIEIKPDGTIREL